MYSRSQKQQRTAKDVYIFVFFCACVISCVRACVHACVRGSVLVCVICMHCHVSTFCT